MFVCNNHERIESKESMCLFATIVVRIESKESTHVCNKQKRGRISRMLPPPPPSIRREAARTSPAHSRGAAAPRRARNGPSASRQEPKKHAKSPQGSSADIPAFQPTLHPIHTLLPEETSQTAERSRLPDDFPCWSLSRTRRSPARSGVGDSESAQSPRRGRTSCRTSRSRTDESPDPRRTDTFFQGIPFPTPQRFGRFLPLSDACSYRSSPDSSRSHYSTSCSQVGRLLLTLFLLLLLGFTSPTITSAIAWPPNMPP